MGKTVHQLLSEIDSAELTEWQAYYQLEPFGSLVEDERHGVAVSALANINRDAKTHPQPYKPLDFIGWRVHERIKEGPILLADAQAQSDLLAQQIFKFKPRGKNV